MGLDSYVVAALLAIDGKTIGQSTSSSSSVAGKHLRNALADDWRLSSHRECAIT
jgi:hypothetical protein